MRLGQAKSAQQQALRQWHQPVFFLRGVAVAQQDGVDRAVGHTDGRAGAAVASGNFFQHQRQRDMVKLGAAPLFGHADAVGAQRRQATVRIMGKLVLAIPARGVGPQLLLGKGAHRVANHFLFWAQQH